MKARAYLSRVLSASTYPNFQKEMLKLLNFFVEETNRGSPIGHPANPVEADFAAREASRCRPHTFVKVSVKCADR